MPEPTRRIRRRRPIAWNQLLSKGHAHDVGRTATRRAQRQAIEADLDAYFDDQQSGTKDGTDLSGFDLKRTANLQQHLTFLVESALISRYRNFCRAAD